MVYWFDFTRGFTEHFTVGDKLGEGAYGCTHICFEKSTGHEYAVKILRKEGMQPEDREAVQKEVKILKTVSQSIENIVVLYGVFEDSTAVYLLLELCTGGELFDHIKEQGSFSEADAANIVRQILRVTAECHLNGIIHRDLKPENFLYASKGLDVLKAIDFGLSDFFKPDTKFTRIVGSPYYVAPEVLKKNYGPAADVWSVGVIAYVLLCGGPYYVAPEVLKKNYGPAADVWSVGVIAYVLLCGGPPFWGETDEELFDSIIDDPLDLETDPWPDVSESAKDLLRRLLTKDGRLRLSASQALSHPWVREGGAAPQIPLCYDIVNSLHQFSKQSALKRLFFKNFAQNWDAKHQLQSLADQFTALDKDNSGKVTLSEFQAAIEAMRTGELGESVFNKTSIDTMLKSLDSDGDGTLDYEEFLAAAVQTLRLEDDAGWSTSAKRAFSKLDTDGNGYLTYDELEFALGTGSTDLRQMVAEIDRDRDGRVDFDEFQ
eukprot:CAMPEP_0177621010 /NCGR_PEP_ID=MMETSP0419_2-20121207/27298_1 /TAXON_ID=582737 /ORGANISM="Tetraselmis sp., Strain GSL018" /LENGTH=488 /DNA_ID=CAMNT_0019120781 /DNA_START=215 /DNA_END=1678 /DNA_ORIENTATION=-